MLRGFFNNYETVKLQLQNPDLNNAIILGIILVCICIGSGRNANKKLELLNRAQTEQLRGIAIILVVMGHFWIHVSEFPAVVVLSSEAVALFFMLSGFGLVMSAKQHNTGIMIFLTRRLKRVMVPYWLLTLVILFLDFLLLGRTYSWNDLIATFLGVNINLVTKHIDYVRWYISFLLAWYLLFLITFYFKKRSNSLLLIVGFAIIIFISNYYLFKFGWYQIFAFPAGCAIGYYFNSIQSIFIKYFKWMFTLSAMMLLYVIIYKIYFSAIVESNIPYILLKLLNEFSSIIFSIAIIILVAALQKFNFQSACLLFCGRISYGLFFIHGVFLIKYNPFICQNSILPLPLSFTAYLLFVIILAFFFQKLIEMIYLKIM